MGGSYKCSYICNYTEVGEALSFFIHVVIIDNDTHHCTKRGDSWGFVLVLFTTRYEPSW